MIRAILLSVQSKPAMNILNGYKTLELRKNVPKDFKGWVYIYCTHTPKHHHVYDLTYVNNGVRFYSVVHHNKRSLVPEGYLNGKVVARFWFDEYTHLYNYNKKSDLFKHHKKPYYCYRQGGLDQYIIPYISSRLCLTEEQINNYGKGKDIYALHIKKLEIFAEPMELSEFNRYDDSWRQKAEQKRIDNIIFTGFEEQQRVKKAPQSWQYVYVKEQDEDEFEKY